MEGPWRVGESLLKSDLTLAGYETSCSLHYPGGFTLHSAHAIEVWRVHVFGMWGHLHDVRVTTQMPSLGVPTWSLLSQC